MAKFILNDDGSFTQEKKRKKQTSKYEELKNVPFTGQSKFKTQSEDKYFKKSEGNVGQAIGNTVLDTIGNATEGALNYYEGWSDKARYASANVLDFFGADKKAEEIRKRALENDTADIVEQWERIWSGDLSGTKKKEDLNLYNKIHENSILADKGRAGVQSAGNSLAGALTAGYLGAPITGASKGAQLAKNAIGLTSFGVSASGHGTTEAYKEGANDLQAGIYGMLTGATEAGSEMLFGGLGKINQNLGFGTGALDDVLIKSFTKNIKNSLVKNLATVTMKSAGEGVEEIASLFGEQLARKIVGLDTKSIKEMAKDGTIADTFVQGMFSSLIMQTPSAITYTAQGRDINTGLTRTQQQYVNEIAQQRMVEAQRRNARLNGMQKSRIEDRALTDYQRGRLADANKLQQVNLPGLSTKDMDLQQSAYKYGINPNSEAVVEMKTLFDNRDIVGIFDADRFKGSNENAFWSRNENGKREVVLNPNASPDVLLEEIAIHELTHDLMSSENSQEIIDNQKIMDYVSTLDGYEEARAKVEKLYAKQTKGKTAEAKKAYIDEEIVADTLGKNIGSQEYIRRLIDDEPSIAKNIYDWVVNKVANKNGVRNEKAYWNNVKNNFEKAYNMEYQGKGSDTRHALALNSAMDKHSSEQNARLRKAYDLKKQGYSDDYIWTQTGTRLIGNEDALLYVDDLKFKNNVDITKLPEGTYKASEILDGDLLKNFKEIGNLDVEITNLKDVMSKITNNKSALDSMDSVGGSASLDEGIKLNSKYINDNKNNPKLKQMIEELLSHEVQHIIQDVEYPNSGETLYFGIDKNTDEIFYFGDTQENAQKAYRNHPKEIEAEVTNLQNAMTKEQRHKFPLDLLFDEVKNHYKNNIVDIKTTQFINELEKKYGKDLEKWYTNSRNGVEKDAFKRYTYGNQRNIEDQKALSNSKKNAVVDVSYGDGRKTTGYLEDFKRKSKLHDGTSDRAYKELDNSSFSLSEQLENQANEVAKKEIAERQAMIELFEDYLSENDITNPTEQDIYNSLDEYDVYDANESFDQEGQKKYFDTIKKYLKEQNQDVRYSLTDNQGRELTKEQQEFFKDSKVRDEQGRLLEVYHGTNSNFNIYDKDKIGTATDEGMYGEGFYFTDDKKQVKYYGNKIKKQYLNITNPLTTGKGTDYWDSKDYVYQKLGLGNRNEITKKLIENPDSVKFLTPKEISDYLQKEGYDGIIHKPYNGAENEYIVFNSNQIKNVDNTNPTDDPDIRKSQQNEGWQSFLDKNFEAKGTKTRLDDIKLPGLTKAVQEEVQKQTSNALLPIANELKELNKNLTKVMNPSEIAQLTPQDADTTPILPGITRNKVGDGKSKFFDNIKDKTNMLSDETKTAILSSDDVKYYDKVTNKESLDKAYARLQKNGRAEVEDWLNKTKQTDGKDARQVTSVDVAEGWILLKQTNDAIEKETDPIRKHQLLQSSVNYAINLRDIGSKAGQVIQAFNILSRLTPEGMVYYAQKELSQAYDQMVQNKTKAWIDKNKSKFELQPNEVQFILDTMKDVSTMEDGYDKRFKLAQIQKVLTDKLPPAKGAGMKAWMRISMLFNPKTQVRNVAGNALIAPVNAFGDMFASFADKVIGSKTGVRTTGNFNLKDYASGMKKGLYESYNDFKHGVNTRNIQGNRFEVTEGKSFNDNNAIGKALNRVDNLLSFVLDAGDRGFYEASFVNSINNQMVLNNTTEVTQDMIDIATQEALSRTWQDNNEYTKFVTGMRNELNRLVHVNGYGLGDVLIPFAKTPANLTKAIVDYSPVGLVSAINKGIKLNRSLTNGQYNAKTQHEFVQSLGKATAGTILYVLGYALAQAGITSGASDDDKDVANFLKNTLGKSSYSIQIGGKTFTYDWAQPIAAPLSMMANLVQKEKEGATLAENITTTLDTGLNLLFEQSFLESMSNVFSQPGEIGTKMIDQFLDLPSRAVPTLFKQIADLVDGTQRQTYVKDKPIESMVNEVKAKIPGLSQTLAPSVDTLGREIQKYGGKNNLFNVFLNPANVNAGVFSESGAEIYRLYKETGETNIMPRVAPYYVNKKGEKIILSTKQRAEYQKVSGSIIENNVAKLLESTEYKNMSDKDKASVVNDIVNYSYNIAQNQVLGTELSKDYVKAYEYSQIGDISDYYEFRNSIDDTNSKTERESVFNYLYNSDLDDNQIAKLYRSCNYSTDKTINAMLELRIPMKEFVKYDTAEIEGKYNPNTGKTINGSKKNAIIEYVNGLNLSKAQKAILIKGTNTFNFDTYNNDIIRYVNTLNGSVDEKKVLLKSIGFDNYDRDVVRYIKSQGLSQEETEKKLEDLGFTIRDGRVYY